MSSFASEARVKEEVGVKEEEEEEEEDDLDFDFSNSPSVGTDELSVNLDSPTTDDKNNNKSSSRRPRRTKRLGVKRTYGLRPRTQLRRPSYDCESEDKEAIVTPRKEPRSKIRGSIVAKYRRLTANARERQRMKEINDAFTTLQGILPALQNRQNTTSSSGSSRTSMTKIRTLRHAASYIQALSDLLSGGDPQGSSSYHKEFQTYTGSFQNTPTSIASPSAEGMYCGSQQTLSKTQANKTVDINQEAFRPTYIPTSRSQEEHHLPVVVDKNLQWEDVQPTEEELLSLLEKEVMNMRNNQLQTENNPSSLGDLNWNEDFVPMGCK